MTEVRPARPNRFHKHRVKISLLAGLGTLLAIEGSSSLLVWSFGHSGWQTRYEPNRIISGYTVYRHTPGYDFGASTIRRDAAEPSVVIDPNGFVCEDEVTEQKPPDVVRVFLMGGSAALSSGQTENYSHVHRYPWGVYSYRHSLAGQLREFLERSRPGHRFQVITAAAFERKLHQSLVEYLATVSRFDPDIVITLDGMNDLQSLTTGTPYHDAESLLPAYIDLWNEHYRPTLWERTNTAYVLSRLAQRWGWGVRHQRSSAPVPPPDSVSPDAYRVHRAQLIASSQRFLQTVRQFQAVVRADGAHFVFALQPLLHRRGANKQLSARERQFDQLMPANGAASGDAVLKHLANRFLWDDYLSAEIARQAEAAGAGFVDVNRALTEVTGDVEVFTDYCHLTWDGQRITGEILGRACLPWISAAPGN